MKHEITFWNSRNETQSSLVNEENGWDITDLSAWNKELKLGFSWSLSNQDGLLELRIPHNSIREEGKNTFKSM